MSITEHLLLHLKSKDLALNKVYLRSDEAGCYHNNFLVAAVQDVRQHVGVSVVSYDFSEPNFGKDICDRIICPLKTAFKTYVNEWNDICNAHDMRTALLSRPVRGTSAAVCEEDETRKTLKVNKIDGISKFHNFKYEEGGVRVWKAKGVGEGKTISADSLYVKHQGPTGLWVEERFFENEQTRDLKPLRSTKMKHSDTTPRMFECSEPNCHQSFSSFRELELHLDVGSHDIHPEQ